MIRILAAFLALIAGQAHALSCVRPDVAESFLRADAAEASYVVLLGSFIFDEKRLPRVDWDNQTETPPSTRIPATFSGLSLSRSGFDQPFSGQVIIDATCLGPWCSSPQSGTQVLAFVEKEGWVYTFTTSPCGGWGFWRPSVEDITRVERCMRGKDCVAAVE